jgi:hypothetical protein
VNVEQNYQLLDSFVKNSNERVMSTDGKKLREFIKNIRTNGRLDTSDAEVQTTVSMPVSDDSAKSLEELLELNRSSDLTPIEAQLKLNLDNFVAKMTTFSERNGNALLKFAKTRSFHELVKIQRFLLVINIFFCFLNLNSKLSIQNSRQ